MRIEEELNECKRCKKETAHSVYCPVCLTVLMYKAKHSSRMVVLHEERDTASE